MKKGEIFLTEQWKKQILRVDEKKADYNYIELCNEWKISKEKAIKNRSSEEQKNNKFIDKMNMLFDQFIKKTEEYKSSYLNLKKQNKKN